MVPMLRI